MFFLKVFCVICVCQTAIGKPTATVQPGEYQVAEGGTAVFSCTVTGRDDEDIRWQGLQDGGVKWSYSATSMTVIDDRTDGFFENVNFKNRTVKHNESYDEVFELRISNVRIDDANYDYYCVYVSTRSSSIFYMMDSARLVVPIEASTELPSAASIGIIAGLAAVAAVGWCLFIIILIIFLYCLKRKFICSYAEKPADVVRKKSVNNNAPTTSVDNGQRYEDLCKDDIGGGEYTCPSVPVYEVEARDGPFQTTECSKTHREPEPEYTNPYEQNLPQK